MSVQSDPLWEERLARLLRDMSDDPDPGEWVEEGETAALLSMCKELLDAEAEAAGINRRSGLGGEVGAPVIHPGEMAKFQAEWRRRPALRCCIRAVGSVDAEARAASMLLTALHEMSLSAEWRRQPGGRWPYRFWPEADLGEGLPDFHSAGSRVWDAAELVHRS